MTCDNPMHRTQIWLHAETYCAECYFAGYNKGKKTPRLEITDPVLKQLLSIAHEAKRADNDHYSNVAGGGK